MSVRGKSFLTGSILLSLVAGCSHFHSHAPDAAAQPAGSQSGVLQNGNGGNSPAKLAQQTTQYAQNVGPLIDQSHLVGQQGRRIRL